MDSVGNILDLLETFSGPAVVIDSDLIILHRNRAAVEIFSDVKAFTEIFPNFNAKQEGLATHYGSHPKKLDQHLRWTTNRAGGFIYALGEDVSENERTDEKLMQALKELNDQKYALDQAAIVAITDRQGKITYANDRFAEISKYSLEELIGEDHRIVNSGHHTKKFMLNLWRTILGGNVWIGEIKNKAKDGTFYWVQTTIVPFCDQDNHPYQFMAIRTDITAKKKVEELIEEEHARTLHAEKMASLGEMAAGIAHELGNPAAAIVSWIDVIAREYEAGSLENLDLSSTIETVRLRAHHMQRILKGMLTYARDGSKDSMEILNLKAQIGGVLEYCAFRLKKWGISLTNDVPTSIYIKGRETELSQVFVNIINNAIDALAGTESPWIAIECIVDRDIRITVTDSGPGIPKEVADRVLMPFFTTKKAGKGTGLGLSISRKIVVEHGGELSLDTEYKAHTRFVITLPKVTPD